MSSAWTLVSKPKLLQKIAVVSSSEKRVFSTRATWGINISTRRQVRFHYEAALAVSPPGRAVLHCGRRFTSGGDWFVLGWSSRGQKWRL